MRSTQIVICRLAEAGGLLQELLGRWSQNGPRQLRGICRQALARADRHLLEGSGGALVLPLYPARAARRAGSRKLG